MTSASSAIAAYGLPHWNHLEFAEETQIGGVRIQLTVDTRSHPTRLSELSIHVNGKRLRIPKRVTTVVTDPHLSMVRLMRLGSVECIDNSDCSVHYPVELYIPYGPRYYREPGNDKCETSELQLNFFADEVQSASYYDCEEADKGKWQELYQRPGA